MTINNNLMNPVPLWTSKNDWYCKKATNHGNCVPPVFPTGMMPKMALTVVGAPNSASRSITITQDHGMPSDYIRTYTGNVSPNPKNQNNFNGILNAGEHSGQEPIILITNNNGVCSVKFRYWYSDMQGDGYRTRSVYLYDDNEEIENISKDIIESGGHVFQVNINGTNCTFKMSAVNLDYYSSRSISVILKKLSDESTVATQSFNGEIEGCGLSYNTLRSGSMFLGGTNFTGTFADGVYYIQFTLDGTTYYSEPFMWLTNLNQYLHVTYRRSTPVVTTDNCIVFEFNGTARSLEAWLPGLLMMPPFTFNDEVDEIDGRKFVRKQVSYKDEKCEFMCTAYFAEAIRLLWHCDIRTAGTMRVEYMVRPEIGWNNDNHLCTATLEFQGDTVMQTNSTASAYGDSSDSSHQSYDSSFDASFN